MEDVESVVAEMIVGTSQATDRLRKRVCQAACNDRVTVLITGEPGTGKELVAQAIHQASARRGRPMVALNLAEYDRDTLAGEMLGTAAGRFTDVRERPGFFEEADGSTLFLDEIGELSNDTQVRLLRILQERKVRRHGATTGAAIDIRLITATNADLATGRLRPDFLRRIDVFRINLVPLRERRDDIRPLAFHFAKDRDLSPAAIARLEGHDWPGNARELKNVIDATLTRVGNASILGADDLENLPTAPARVISSAASAPIVASATPGFESRLKQAIVHLEAAWDAVFEPPADPGDRRHLEAPESRIGAVLAGFCDRMGLPDPTWRALRDPGFRPRRSRGLTIARLDNGTTEWILEQLFPDGGEHDVENRWLRWTLLDQMIRRYRATLSQVHRAEIPWLVPLKADVGTAQTFDDVMKRVSDKRKDPRTAWIQVVGEDAVVAAEEAATRSFLPAEVCAATHARIDSASMRASRFASLAGTPTAFAVPGTAGALRLPFVAQHLPEVYRATTPTERTFAYEVERGPHDDEWFQLPPEIRAERLPRLRELAGSLRTHGAVFDNGQGLAALHSVTRGPSSFQFRFHKVTYFDYVMANLMAPLYSDIHLDDPGLMPERVWSSPHGAFFGLSALVITADKYVVLQVRDGLPAADRWTINASISGGMDRADLDHPHPLEAGLLREGTSEISKLLARAVDAGASLTYLGWLRNTHRAYLPELAWLVELHHTGAEAWLKSKRKARKDSWRSLARQRPEGFETASEHKPLPKTGEPWMPALLFVKRERLVAHAHQILDVAHFPTHDPRVRNVQVDRRWPFAWLRDDVRAGRRGGQPTADVHTTLDCDRKFNDEHWDRAAYQLALRQPALPLMSTLALYITMLERRGELPAGVRR